MAYQLTLRAFLRPISFGFAACLVLLNFVVGAQQDHLDQLPDLGSNAANYLSETEAKQLGLAFIRSARAQMDFINDPELTQYINSIGQNLVKNSSYSDYAFSFYLIDNPVINAFAVPGGHVALNTGILLRSESESELASVMAHEIAHITQKHISRRIESSRYDSLIALGTLLAAAAAGGSDGAAAALSVSNAGILQRRLSYSRSFEAEADALGIRLLSKANYSPEAMPIFFKRLLEQNRLSESNGLEFLRSHPLTINRITESSERARGYPDNWQGDNQRFNMMKAKARAYYSKSPQSVRDLYQSKIELGDNSLPTRYGYAAALSKNTQFDEAREAIKVLLKEYPNNLTVKLLQAENELEANHLRLGLAQMQDIYQTYSERGDSLIALYYGNALLLARQPEQAIPILREGLTNNPGEPIYQILLSRAYGESGQDYQAFVSRAEFHIMRGNYKFALAQLKQAEKYAKTDYEKARLEARIEEVDKLIAALDKLTS